jgi:glycine/D-amino acid oxidase-like deaminating enzyme
LRIYSRPEAGGLIVGMYGAVAVPHDTERLSDDFDMSAMRPLRDESDVAALIDVAAERFPFLAPAAPMKLTHGIMTFSPDCRPFCGPDRDIQGLYHCAGFSGHGIAQSPTIGLIMTQLILDGETLYDVDALAADRYFDEPDLQSRAQIKRRCAEAYRDYYGKVVISGE